MKPKFWNWLDDADSGERTLMLNGTITYEAWFEDSVTPSQFRTELSKCSGDVSVWINSPGGGVLAAAQIYNMLMEYPGNVRVRIDGLAASAATVVAMAGNVVEISPVGCMFVHNPEAMSIGNASDHRLTIEMLSEIKECIINAYEIKTGRNRKAMLSAIRSNFRNVSNVLQEGVDADGGYLVPEEYDSHLIDILTEDNIIRNLGTKLNTSGERKINIAATKPAALWIEEGGALSFGDATFDQIILDAYKLHVTIKITEELL